MVMFSKWESEHLH